MAKRILVKKDNYIVNGLWKDGQMIQFDIDEKTNFSPIGTIYIGKVKDIVKNIQAAFVELSEGKKAYFSLREAQWVLPIGDTSKRPLKVGDEILVQISRDAIKTKDPVVTGNITFTGKYAAVIYGDRGVNISSKISDAAWRKQTKQLAEQALEQSGILCHYPCGIIVRTNAYEAEEEEVLQEIKSLLEQLEQLRNKVFYRKCFSKLYEAPVPYLTALRDTREELEQIVTDDKEIYHEVLDFLQEADPEKAKLLTLYEDKLVPLKAVYSTEKWLERALNKQVWLNSGGYLIIEPTEALTVIDVNSGKSITGKNAEDTFFRMNMEAATEIARQLRLRNLSGIIIVDFINMKEQKHKDVLMIHLGELLRKDSVKAMVVDMTKLGLVEITRQRSRKPIYEIIGKCSR